MKRLSILIINAALITLFFCWPIYLVRADNLTLIINEIGAYESSGHEWLEILNVTNNPVDITGWKFWENETNHGLKLFSGDDLIIDAGEYAIIAQKADVFVTDYPEVTTTIIDSAWSSLRESGEKIGLKDTDGNFVEVFTYIPAPDFSLERTDSNLTDYSTNNWQEHADSNTVGFVNSDHLPSGQEPPDDENEDDGTDDTEDGQDDGDNNDDDPIDDTNDQTENITEPEEVNVPKNFMPSDIVINEIVSDPAGDDEEWIELYSTYPFPISLEGWVIEDGSERQMELTGSILGRQFYVIEELKFQLNNSGDTLVLKSPNGDYIDFISYGKWNDGNITNNALKPKDGQSLARNLDGKDSNNDFNDFSITTTPTKGFANLIAFMVTDESGQAEFCDLNTDIIINEIFPNPSGSDSLDEWIELKNVSENKIDIEGWKLSDATKRRFTISKDDINTEIEPSGFLVLKREITKIALNNSGQEFVKLFTPDGCMKDEVAYSGKVANDTSYSLNNNDKWQWNINPTPGDKNIIVIPNSLPHAVIEAPTQAYVGEIITFDASDSSDPDGDILTFEWDFGDEGFDTATTTEHTYTKTGQYEVELLVEDSKKDQVKVIHIIDVISENKKIDIKAQPVFDFAEATILISEFLPNPVGSDTQEWIELYNPTDWPIDLTNWQIDDSDGGSKPYLIPLDTIIESKQYLVFPRVDTKIALNNSSDSVRLFDPAGNLVDQIDYEKIGEGNTLAIDEYLIWQETSEITPGLPNKISFVENKKGTKNKTITETTLEEIKDFEVGDIIRVTGTVSVEPGILASQIFYISGSSGLQIYMYKKDFPTMKIGDLVEVSGTLAESNGEKRLKISAKEDINVISHNKKLEPQELMISEIDDDLTGSLVKISGQITEIKSSTVWVDDGTEEVQIYLKKGTKIKKEFEEGDFVNLTGILSKSKNGLRILPRSQKDIVISKVAGVSNIDEQIIGNEARSTNTKYFIVIMIGLGIIVAKQSLKIKKLSNI